MDLSQLMNTMGLQAREASYQLAKLSADEKNAMLSSMSQAIRDHAETIEKANQKDMATAKENNLSSALLDRLALDATRIEAMAAGFDHVVTLPDPVGEILHEHKHANGMSINKTRTPIGVIGIIYESRPNVTADVAALCIKTGNAIILRGGSEAFHSNQAIANALLIGGSKAGLPMHAIQLFNTTDRDAVRELVQCNEYVDLAIPRGGEGLIDAVVKLATVPIIKHYKGLCHTFIDATADLNIAIDICVNAKCQRPGVCNAMETLLVHKDIAATFLPELEKRMSQFNVELRADKQSYQLLRQSILATEADWDTEYLDLILSIKIVDDVEQAIQHINQHGSHHSDAIISKSPENQQQFTDQIDSATVYINASTRFTDGSEFGMGAEIGISTDKLHARGPMGLEELTTYKYIITGNGQTR